MGFSDDLVFEPCMKSELDLFNMPLVDVSSTGGGFVELHPISSIEGGDSIEFFDPALSDQYTVLSKTMMKLKVKVTKADGTRLGDAETDKAALVNNSMHSLFSHINVSERRGRCILLIELH